MSSSPFSVVILYFVISLVYLSFVPSVMALPLTIPLGSMSPVSFDHQTLSMKIREEAVVHIVPSSNGCDVTCMHISMREPERENSPTSSPSGKPLVPLGPI